MKLVLLLETDVAVERFLAMASDALPAGERIVRATEIVGESKLIVTLPRDAGAELVAREAPMVLPGGLTALASYYRVRDAAALEIEMREGAANVEREVVLTAPS